MKNFGRSMGRFTRQNGSWILAIIGLGGMIAGTFLACRATVKATKDVMELEKDIPEEERLTKSEIVKREWKHYIPAISVLLAGTASMVGSCAYGKHREMAIGAAYEISEKSLSAYKKHVLDEIGEEKAKDIQEKVTEEVTEAQNPKNSEVVIVEKDGILCYEPLSGRYFKSTAEKIHAAINEVNRELQLHDYVTLNDVFYNLGLSETVIGDLMGWPLAYGLIDIDLGSMLSDTEHGKIPCLTIDFVTRPRYDKTFG